MSDKKKDSGDIVKSAAELAMEKEEAEQNAAEPEATLSPEEETFKEKYLRARADLENFQRRRQDEKAHQRINTIALFVKDLLPFIDGLEQAVKAAENDTSEMGEGVRLTWSLLEKTLAENNIHKISADGQFDEHLHEAVTSVPNADVPDQTIIDVIENGYKLGDKVIRYAKVVVSSKPEND